MNRQHADAELGGFANCGSNSRGDAVVFQIKKYAAYRSHQLAHDLRAFGGVRVGHLRMSQLQTDPLQILSLELQHASGAVRHVYDAAQYTGAAVIDFDDYRASVAQIGDPHEAAQGQSWVGGGQVVHVIR